jgi:hypothetical protein
MPARRSKSKKKSKSASRNSAPHRSVEVETATGETVSLEPVTDVVTEQTEVTTEPEVEIRKPATLAQALTEPATAVVKPNTKVRRKVIERKRVS